MSSSSKYSALPYIASGEQDVFETEELPESEQSTFAHPAGDASVEIIPSGTVEAFQKFANDDGKFLKNEILANESYETKLERIKSELGDLESLIKNELNNSKVDHGEMNQLLTRLDDLQGTLLFGDNSVGLKKAEDASDQAAKGNKSTLEESRMLSKLNLIDQRISKIEAMIGKVPSSNASRDESIVSIVAQLRGKVSQLDPASLDKLNARVNAILEKVKQISETKSSLEEIEKDSKLNELYECYVKTNSSREMLVNTCERMQVLDNLQEQASHFSSTLTDLKSCHDEMQLSIDTNCKTLKTLQENFTSKSTEIKKTMEDFSKRLEELKNQSFA